MKLIQFALFNKFGCSIYHTLLATFLLCVIMACSSSSSNKNRESPSQPKALDKTLVPQFELHQKDHTGLDFENVLQQSSEFNVFNYMYFFNGGGVSVGDFNQDGKQDVFFTSNMGSNKLFLNEGNLQFKDVTEQAQLAGMDGWTAGCSVVDINNDGMLDIYVSQMGEFQTIKGRNQLYVCQKIENGIPVFEDKAADYGLDFKVFGTQSSFFDYDLDGDLDLFLLNHSLHANGTFGQKKTFVGTQHPESGDKLLRNDDGKFTDITLQAGINSTVIGYGLGLATGDINLDGYPDIYIGNDFHENDYLYLNQKDGTFKEVLEEQIRHTSRFSMGVDMADINNDGWSEIISLDMLSYDPFILKTSLGEDDFKLFNFKMGYGYNAQFARNNLQLNNGDGTFSEIGRFANVYATDWSWTPLLFDFDHDGYRDLFISNGIPRRMNDIDYINFRSDHDLRFKQQSDNLEKSDLVYIEKMPQIKLPNKFFCNQKTLQFQDIETQIINNQTSYSNGAAYADFDGDGDLDV
ncbi:MAG: FG-GAP repeat domain-containing protein, partial [Chitinophagales bacterium]